MKIRTDVSTLTILSLSDKYTPKEIAKFMDCSIELVRKAIRGERTATPQDELNMELIDGLGDKICSRCEFRVIAKGNRALCTTCQKRGDPYVEHSVGRSI